MNKKQIKEELRRSACEDYYPIHALKDEVCESVYLFLNNKENVFLMHESYLRIFYLLVAEAL